MSSGKFSMKSIAGSFRFAFRGLISLVQNEHNSRIHLLAAVLVFASGFLLKITLTEWCLLITTIGFVFVAELINSSLEAISDVIEPEWNEKIRTAKDYSAAAVLISAIVSVFIGGFIFIPRLLLLI